MELFNEVIILAVCLGLPVFTEFVESSKAAYDFGLGVILLIILNVLVNAMLTLWSSVRVCLLKARRRVRTWGTRESSREKLKKLN
mmetsp:Transcript_28152/g.42603  ORF Transcript_28152/g.42603 Transcript_28152/m.42603 type:complete len:85 (-) Transcript_28152:676-930(-)